MILTEAILGELHQELPEKLKTIHGKPLMITVTYKDEKDDLQYWICTNNDFDYPDMELTFKQLLKQAAENHKPRNIEVVKDFKEQIRVRERPRLS